jgi:transposase
MSLPVAPLGLPDGDRAELGRLLASGPARLAERAQIVLACAEPSAGGNAGVAAELGLTADTVRKWRERFSASGVAGLADGARPGRPKAGLVLTGAEREQLTRWARRGKTSQVLALRAKIVLACADGRDNKVVAAEFGVGEHMIARWRAGSPASAWPG